MTMSMLPEELIMEIFRWLPASDVFRFRYLNKSYNSWIQSEQFINLHQRTTFENIEKTRRWRVFMLPDCSLKVEGLDILEPLTHDLVVGCINLKSLDFIGSANGLICVYMDKTKTFLVWNPCTKVSYICSWDCYKFDYSNPVTVPVDDSDVYSDVDDSDGDDDDYHPDFEWFAMGFGPSVHGYKIIRIHMCPNYPRDHSARSITVEISVLILGVTAPRINMVMVPQMAFYDMGLYLHGALHWMDRQSNIPMGVRRGIVIYSLDKEEFEQQMPLPEDINVNDEEKIQLRIVCGKLTAFLCVTEETGAFDFVMWSMEEYGVKDLWTRKLMITDPHGGVFQTFMEPVSLLRNGSVVMNLDFKTTVVYNTREKTYSTIIAHFLPQWCYWRSPPRIEYVETLVSPLCTKLKILKGQGDREYNAV